MNIPNFTQKYRTILRENAAGNLAVVETINSDYAILYEGEVVAIYEQKNYALKEFGRLSRV